jgi:broad specificity phosphatase PhoE
MDDVNALRKHKFDGPLKEGQEELLASIVSGIEAEIKNETTIKILYTSETRRIKETALGIAEYLSKRYSVVMEDDSRLVSIDRGELILPQEYQDGEWFSPLDDAWEYANEEMFLHKNIFYRFGDHFHGKYPKLTESFYKPGNSFGESLIKRFSLICDLIDREETD